MTLERPNAFIGQPAVCRRDGTEEHLKQLLGCFLREATNFLADIAKLINKEHK